MRSNKYKKRIHMVKPRTRTRIITREKVRTRAKTRARRNRKKTRRLAGAPSRTFIKDFYIKYGEEIKERERVREAQREAERQAERDKILMERLHGECSICLDPLDEDDDMSRPEIERAIRKCSGCFKKKNLISKLPCDHFFHEKCIDEWSREKLTCPECRSDMPVQYDPYR